MWQQVAIPPLSERLTALTTSVWLHEAGALVGVMRNSMLAPPCLWATVLPGGSRKLRQAPELLTGLQQLIYAPTVLAEVELDQPRNQALMLFLGFEELPAQYERKLYRRSI